jgi:hypothetical protein
MFMACTPNWPRNAPLTTDGDTVIFFSFDALFTATCWPWRMKRVPERLKDQ